MSDTKIERKETPFSDEKNIELSDDESEDDESEDDNEKELPTLLSPLSFTDNSDLYIVSVNGLPRFYVKDEKTASDKMWELSRKLASTEFFAGYRTNLLRISNKEIHLLGSYRFFLIAYDTILHRISYSRISECV